jgi:hypothetical protein
MDAKVYLNNIRQMMLEKNMWERHLERIDEMISTPAIQYDAIRVTSSPNKDSMERMALKHLEECQKIIDKINSIVVDLIQKQCEALTYIRQIESQEQQEVLILYYINAMQWREIAEIKDVDEIASQMHLRDRAINSLQKIFDGHTKDI